MRATLVICLDPFRPANGRTVTELRRRRRIRTLAPRTPQPFICLHNGNAVLRKDWSRCVEDGDTVAFVMLPQGGGGGKNPLSIVLQIALMAISGPAAGALMGTMEGWGYMIAKAAIGIVGSMLINAMLPAPRPPAAQQMSAAGGLASPSPTYSLSSQGNQARLGQPIPELLGRHLVVPDFAAAPYCDYAGNEQYLYELLMVSQGTVNIESILLEDTPITNFPEVTVQIVLPGEKVTLFPAAVVTSLEVSGQEALTGTPLGPFVLNAAGTQINRIAFDVVNPRGLYWQNDSGGQSAMTCSWTAEAQPIDDDGNALGPWILLAAEAYTAATTTPQRMSYGYSVPAGRYQVRLTRTDAKQTDTRYGHELDWVGLRGYLPGDQDYGDVTLVALRMRATNSLSAQSSRKVRVIGTRCLPIWSPGGWTERVPTQNPAWALAHICKASYGGNLPDSRFGLADLYALSVTWETRGDRFCGIFDSQSTVWEALTQVARAGRAQPYRQGGIYHFVRDEARTLPVTMFSMRNIKRGSFSLHYLMPTGNTADAVEVTYFDESVWSWRPVLCVLPGGTSAKPAKVQMFGVPSRTQAWREGMFMAACNKYRRRLGTLGTEMEGFIPSLGDLCGLQHGMAKWGQSGDIVAWDAPTKTAVTSQALDWSAGGPHRFYFRRRDGSSAGPFVATIGTDAHHVVLTDWVGSGQTPDPTPDTGGARERSHYYFGPASAEFLRVLVKSVRPQSATSAQIEFVAESDYVHSADTGAPPGQNAWQLPGIPTRPVLVGLIAHSMPLEPDKMLVSWQPSPGADRYRIEQSNGDGRWTGLGEISTCSYSGIALYGAATIVGVTPIGLSVGERVEVRYGLTASYAWTNDADPAWTNDADPAWTY